MKLPHTITLALIIFVGTAHAGMTSFSLTEVARVRFQTLSFFIVGYLFMALLVKWLWNYLVISFPRLPRINYRRAIALSLVSGLFLYVILTMISGARELLTPGAWKKEGIAYKLNNKTTTNITPELRLANIIDLQKSLITHAQQNNNKFPSNYIITTPDEIACPIPSKGFYLYFPPTENTKPTDILAAEPLTYGNRINTILNNGKITTHPAQEIQILINRESGH